MYMGFIRVLSRSYKATICNGAIRLPSGFYMASKVS